MKNMRSGFVGVFFLLSVISSLAQGNIPLFRVDSLPVATRVRDLLKALTLEEKISLLGYKSKAVPRLGIPAYNWWNEALHGVARAGNATIFPQAIAMAAAQQQPFCTAGVQILFPLKQGPNTRSLCYRRISSNTWG